MALHGLDQEALVCQSGACFLRRFVIQVRICTLLNSEISLKMERSSATTLPGEGEEGCGAEKLPAGSFRNLARLASILLKQEGVRVPSQRELGFHWLVSNAAACLMSGLTQPLS